MFWLIHLIVLFTFPFALILTIPLHIIINQNNKKSDDISKIATQLKESQDVSKLATQLELQRLANEPKEKHYSEVKNEEAIRQQSIDDKWNTAKKYLNEVKEGLIYINSKVLDDSRSKNGAEIALKEVFSQLGVRRDKNKKGLNKEFLKQSRSNTYAMKSSSNTYMMQLKQVTIKR